MPNVRMNVCYEITKALLANQNTRRENLTANLNVYIASLSRTSYAVKAFACF